MNHTFSEVPKAEIQRSSFDRSSGIKTTFNAGQLVPFFIDEALPGDTFNLKTAGFARMATPIFPIMDNLIMETFYFSVPYRLLWDNWQKMMGEQTNPGDSTDYLVPQVVADVTNGFITGSLADYMGVPTYVPGLSISALQSRAYTLVYNEWFRDQNLQDSLPFATGDGPDDDSTAGFVQNRGKRHDYFTSALPWPQKGPDVNLPLGTEAPVIGFGKDTIGWEDVTPFTTNESDGSSREYANSSRINDDATLNHFRVERNPDNPNYPYVRADLSNATAATINQLRQAFQIQKMYERDARGGTRYTEIIRSHFGVTSPDARLQRPEFLGGGSTPINISPVNSTADTLTDVQTGRNLGALSAVGTASFNNHGFTKSFTEHCIVIGLVNVRADLTYQQGLNRMWSRRDRLDFYWPALANIGEQEVLNKEIYTQGPDFGEIDNEVFGYQERFGEYRYKPSIITGNFRSNSLGPGAAPNTLDAWHLSQDFSTLPVLDQTFILDKPPMDRVLAVTDETDFIADFYHKLICARPMPLFGVPGNIDRF
nr:MAG: major capsid protein [Microvirus sp.]